MFYKYLYILRSWFWFAINIYINYYNTSWIIDWIQQWWLSCKFRIYFYYCLSFIHDQSIMIYLFIISLKSIIYYIVQCIEQYFNNLNRKHHENKWNIDETDQSYDHLYCRSINAILMCIVCLICSIYFRFKDWSSFM